MGRFRSDGAPSKARLDVLLVQRGLFPSREQARGAIMAGNVLVNGEVQDKPGTLIRADAEIVVRGPEHPFVSRGGVKLAAALDSFGLDVSGAVAVDIGASTGGFTDCLLQRGARRVYAVDVGRGQLHPKLRADSRVIPLEGKNARYLRPADIGEPADLVCIDVSFISLAKILPAAAPLLGEEPLGIVGLIKPQFEVGPELVGRGGVVRDPAAHRAAIASVLAAAEKLNLRCLALSPSPLRGPKGNVEFFAHWLPEQLATQPALGAEEIAAAVEAAHSGRNRRRGG